MGDAGIRGNYQRERHSQRNVLTAGIARVAACLLWLSVWTARRVTIGHYWIGYWIGRYSWSKISDSVHYVFSWTVWTLFTFIDKS